MPQPMFRTSEDISAILNWAWAPGASAVSEFHRYTVRIGIPTRITNQWIGFVVTNPQTSHLNFCSVLMRSFRILEVVTS